MDTNILDQSTDTDFRCLHQLLAKVASSDMITALHKVTIDYDVLEKLSSDRYAYQEQSLFPVDTAENTILSKLYFDHQRGLLSEKVASDISDRLDAFLDVHEIPNGIFVYEEVVKTAEVKDQAVTLLPELGLCKVSTEADLVEAASLFTREGTNLTVLERVKFSQNFVKAAAQLKVTKYPKEVAKYAAKLDTDLENTKYLLNARALLADRTGQDGSSYTKLAEDLDSITEAPDREELKKLAEVILDIDTNFGFIDQKYDRHIPCAYSTVFNKSAEESDKVDAEEDLKKLDKSEIISKFGEGALEQVEDTNGEIDYEKLKEVSQAAKAYKPEVDTTSI